MRINRISFSPASLLLLLASGLAVLTLAGCSLNKAVERATPTGGVLFQDDFSDPTSGWLQGQDDIGLVEYQDSGLHFWITGQASAKVSIPRLQFSDTRIEANAIKVSGSDDNEFGLICRYKDSENFYFFTVSSDGYYGIGKYKGNNLYLIGMDKMKTSEYIQQGEAENHLRLDCVGSALTYYVNGYPLGQVYDNDFAFGDVGLLAGTFRGDVTEVRFDNFIVQKP
jgi:hypothetical protein